MKSGSKLDRRNDLPSPLRIVHPEKVGRIVKSLLFLRDDVRKRYLEPQRQHL